MIAVVSLLVSHFLVRDLSKEERNRMETWAEHLHSFYGAHTIPHSLEAIKQATSLRHRFSYSI